MEGDLPGNILKSPVDSDRDFFLHDFYAQDTSINTVIDLDEYFKYRRDDEDDSETKHGDRRSLLFDHNLIFINNIDSFNGKYIAQLLPKLEQTYAEKLLTDTEENRSSVIGDGDEDNPPPPLESNVAEKENIDDGQEKRTTLTTFSTSAPYQIEHLEDLDDPFNEYEYMDALYSLYDVGKLTTLEYAELLQFETDPERLAYLESKFSKLKKKEDGVDKSTATDNGNSQGMTLAADEMKFKSMVGPDLKFIATLKGHHPSSDEAIASSPYVQELFKKNELDGKEFKDAVTKCGIFIVDISDCHGEVEVARSVLNVIVNRLQSIKEWTPKRFEEMNDVVTFILISSLMTWTKTPPLDPEEPDEPLTEKMFSKRRHHPNYLDHYNLEREVLAAAKRMQGKFNAVIISTGVIYGYEQNTLHYLFKSAWLDEYSLPVFGKGSGRIPLIHIDDLTKIIHYLIHNIGISKFVFAVESVAPSLKEITKAVSSTLGSGKVKRIGDDLVFRVSEVSQGEYEKLLSNLNVESALVGEDKEIPIEFKYPSGFVDAIKAEAETFKKCRGLKAIKLFVMGPPGCGRTKVCKALSNYYKINYLSAETAVEMYKQNLQTTINEIEQMRLERSNKKSADDELAKQEEDDESVENEENEEEEEEEDDDEVDEDEEEERLQRAKSKLAGINNSLAMNNGQLEEVHLAKVVKEVLLSIPCQNQGYVLDGFPETIKQTRILFSNKRDENSEEEEEEDEDETEEEGEDDDDESEEDENDDEMKKNFNKKTVPNVVFCLEASDDFLYQTLLRDPDADESQELSEKDILEQITRYRDLNSDNGILLFFDELEIYPHMLNIENDITPNMCVVTRKLMTLIGKTANYESEKLEQLLKENREAQLKQREELRHEKEQEFKKIKDDLIREKLERWAADVDRMKEEEEEILIKESLPARHYLMKFVLPTLTKGLIEVARVKPDDPIDYLAEYIFTNNEDHRNFYKLVHKAQDEEMMKSETKLDN